MFLEWWKFNYALGLPHVKQFFFMLSQPLTDKLLSTKWHITFSHLETMNIKHTHKLVI